MTSYRERYPSRGLETMMVNETQPLDRTSPIDIHVGSRIRLRRTLLGMSQERLGESLGLTFQQVQKYERGSNRVSASRLYHLARVLSVPIQYFFDELSLDVTQAPASQGAAQLTTGFADSQDNLIGFPQPDPSMDADEKLYRRETMELLRAYYRINDPVRKRVFELIKSMVAGEQPAA